MDFTSHADRVAAFGNIIRAVSADLRFTILEIGAVPVEGQAEPFHQIPGIFPRSRIIAFELDRSLCETMNRQTADGIEFFPVALGKTEERRKLYGTAHPMCCSLYKPNEKLLARYNNLEMSLQVSESFVDTVSLDHFTAANGIDDVDFVKIDIQGAELDVFQGGVKTLRTVVALVSEVEFIPLYEDQPLFGEVCSCLSGQDFMFHKFLGMAGRTLRPFICGNDPNFATQQMWSDALFVRDILALDTLTPDKLLKLAVLSFLYGSADLAFHCCKLYDERKGTALYPEVFGL